LKYTTHDNSLSRHHCAALTTVQLRILQRVHPGTNILQKFNASNYTINFTTYSVTPNAKSICSIYCNEKWNQQFSENI